MEKKTGDIMSPLVRTYLILSSLIIVAFTIAFIVVSTSDTLSNTNSKTEIEKTKTDNSTNLEFQFMLLDKHIPSGYQTGMSNNFMSESTTIGSPDRRESIGNIVFGDNSTGKLVSIDNEYSSVIKFTNSSDIWFTTRLSDDYIVNDTETLDKNYNPLIEKEITLKNDIDSTHSHWFKLDSKEVYNEYKIYNSDGVSHPIVMIYLFYNNPTLDQHVRDCTGLYNDVVNHAGDWDYAHAKFSVSCSQSDIFNGRWQ